MLTACHKAVCYRVMGSAVRNPLLNDCQRIYIIVHVYTLICMYITRVPLLLLNNIFLYFSCLIKSLSLVEPNHLSQQLLSAVADYGDTAPKGPHFQTASTRDYPGGM